MRILSRAAVRIDQVTLASDVGRVCALAAELGFQSVVSPTDNGYAIELSRLDDFPPINDIAALARLQEIVDGSAISATLATARERAAQRSEKVN